MCALAPLVDVAPAARLFKALGDEERLRIVTLLTQGELCVCHLEEALGISQPRASRQLAVLRAAGIVEARREGSWIHYRLAPQADALSRGALRELAKTFERDGRLRAQLQRLRRSRGPGACA